MRIDQFLVLNYSISRQKAQDYIEAGYVTCNEMPIHKNSFMVQENDRVHIQFPKIDYVSRAGFKLEEALHIFQIDLTNKVVLDIGCSTGGFTDCCLQHHARLVYAVDVGTDQLHHSLRTHSKVVCMEQTNAKSLTRQDFSSAIDFICMDLSFISVQHMLPIISQLLDTQKEAVILIKPQFEVGKKYIGKNGIVKDKKVKKQMLKDRIDELNYLNIAVKNVKQCSTIGRDGNTEYILHIVKDGLSCLFDLNKIVL